MSFHGNQLLAVAGNEVDESCAANQNKPEQ